MQTMPNKNRTAMAIGVVLLAVVVGAFALWTGNRNNAAKAPEQGTELNVNASPETNLSGTDSTEPAATAETEEQAQPASGTNMTPAASAETQIPATYTVKEHDTLRSIAQQIYNNPDYSAYIEAANEMDDPNDIKVGQELKLPTTDEIKQQNEQKQ
ncbi:MAG TPA: LysM peptidoglycan-binding domain-containing protein [Symbiobacteriaceae bacterium]|nr:LysM peptidoglycan-binding domain-containing protein [Symbiobacteriaceae bacterium]